MGPGGNGRSRSSRSRPPEAPLAERRDQQRPSPVQIRWFRTRVVAKAEGGCRLKSWTPVVRLTGAGGRRHSIANLVPRGKSGRDTVEAAVRQALSGLDGRWTARIAPVDAYRVEIAAPDGFRCLAFIPNPGTQERPAMARRLRDACRRPQARSGLTRWRRAWVLVTEESWRSLRAIQPLYKPPATPRHPTQLARERPGHRS